MWGRATDGRDSKLAHPPKADANRGRVLDPGNIALVSRVGEGLRTGTMVTVSLALFSKPHNPVSPWMTHLL